MEQFIYSYECIFPKLYLYLCFVCKHTMKTNLLFGAILGFQFIRFHGTLLHPSITYCSLNRVHNARTYISYAK